MKTEFKVAELYGEIVVDNRFETSKGTYRIMIRRHCNTLYFFKYRGEVLLECQNLNTAGTKEVSLNG